MATGITRTVLPSSGPGMLALHSSHGWLGLFAGHLLRLRPNLSVGYAVRCAVANYHHAFDREPYAAAESFARSGTLSVANDADPGLHYSAAAATRYRVVLRRV